MLKRRHVWKSFRHKRNSLMNRSFMMSVTACPVQEPITGAERRGYTLDITGPVWPLTCNVTWHDCCGHQRALQLEPKMSEQRGRCKEYELIKRFQANICFRPPCCCQELIFQIILTPHECTITEMIDFSTKRPNSKQRIWSHPLGVWLAGEVQVTSGRHQRSILDLTSLSYFMSFYLRWI